MLSRIRHTWDRFNMAGPGSTVVVALSGGADSTCLLDALDRLKEGLRIKLAVAHFNHGIRSGTSQRDAEFARSMAAELSLPFFMEEGDVPELADRERLSLEEAARRARYGFFDTLPAQFPDSSPEAVKIALGHTADDQAETLLMRLLRGSGPRGLGSIPPVRGRYIRPLIETRRRDIIEYLESRGIEWVEDETNVSTDFLRNRIRHELLPALIRDFNPNLIETLARTADVMRETSELLDEEAARLMARCEVTPDEVLIPRNVLREERTAIALALIEAAISTARGDLRAIRSEHRRAILDAARNEGTAQITLPGECRADIGPEWVRLGTPAEPIGDVCVPLIVPGITHVEALGVAFETSVLVGAELALPDWAQQALPDRAQQAAPLRHDSNIAYLDLDSLPEPLEARNFRDGDRFQPLGMSGTRKLQDVFVDLKIPREKRRRVPIITAGGQIAWVAPLRIAHQFRITPGTKRVLRISLRTEPEARS